MRLTDRLSQPQKIVIVLALGMAFRFAVAACGLWLVACGYGDQSLCSGEERAFGTLADGQVDRPSGPRSERDGDDLAALAGDDQGPVRALEAHVLDVGACGLGHAQPVEGEQRDQRVLGSRPKPDGDQERADLVAV